MLAMYIACLLRSYWDYTIANFLNGDTKTVRVLAQDLDQVCDSAPADAVPTQLDHNSALKIQRRQTWWNLNSDARMGNWGV